MWSLGGRQHGQAGRVVRQHHFQKLAVEPLGSPLDLAEIKTRLEVKIVRAGAVLEIEVDQACGGLPALAAVEQHHRTLHRKGGNPGAPDRGKEGKDLRFSRFLLARGFRDAGAGSYKLHRWDRLDQEI